MKSEKDAPVWQRAKCRRLVVQRGGEVTEFYEGDCRVTIVPMTIEKRGAQCRLIAGEHRTPTKPNVDVPMLKALGNAFLWNKELEQGKAVSPADLAEKKGLDKTWVNETLRLTLLAPDIVEAICNGAQPRTMSLQTVRQYVPSSWMEQRVLWGLML